jgi:DNA-binding CsgD family transcriptional regulator
LGHVRRSLEITTRLNVLLLRNQTAEDALDRMRRGVLALDEAGRITFANAAARDIAAANDGLSIVQRRLRAADPAVQGRLAVLVGTVVGSRGRALDAAPPPLNVTRPSGRKPYLVLAVPFRGETPWSSAGHPAALCFVTDPEREIDISVARLAALYGFTPTEAEIVLALAKGRSLRAAATARGIGLSTARTHLQRVFDKVGVRSQMALVQVVTQAIRDLPIER